MLQSESAFLSVATTTTRYYIKYLIDICLKIPYIRCSNIANGRWRRLSRGGDLAVQVADLMESCVFLIVTEVIF